MDSKIHLTFEAPRFQVIYKGKFYEFNSGTYAYIFQLGVLNEHDKKYGMKALMQYINLVCICIAADSNSTPIEDLAEFVSRKWRTVKKMESYELLDYFYNSLTGEN